MPNLIPLHTQQSAIIQDTTDSELLVTLDDAEGPGGGTEFILNHKIIDVCFLVSVVGASFDQFIIEGQPVHNGAFITLKDRFKQNDIDFFLRFVTNQIDTLADGDSTFAVLFTGGLFAVRFEAALSTTPGVPATRTLEIGANTLAS